VENLWISQGISKRSLGIFLMSVVFCEASFSALDIKWHPNGDALLIIGRDQMCLCFISDSDEVGC